MSNIKTFDEYLNEAKSEDIKLTKVQNRELTDILELGDYKSVKTTGPDPYLKNIYKLTDKVINVLGKLGIDKKTTEFSYDSGYYTTYYTIDWNKKTLTDLSL